MHFSSFWKSLWSRMKASLVGDMPIELDACEICRKTECSQGDWQSCENRLNHIQRIEIDRAKQG